jgi:hypothetical protein
MGETVRVIPPGEAKPPRARSTSEPALAQLSESEREVRPADLPRKPDIAMTQPVEPEAIEEPRATEEPTAIEEPEPVAKPETVVVPDPVEELPAEPAPAPAVSGPASDSARDAVGALFAALRGAPAPSSRRPRPQVRNEGGPPEPEDEQSTSVPGSRLSTRNDVIELRDGRLLPITNRALRGVKKAVTDAQNVALDSLRTEDGWYPDGPLLAEMMRADLIGLWAESYAAGHATAEEMADSKLRRRDTPHSEAAEVFGEDLAAAVSNALIDAGDGQRERQSAISRVFRGWRTDEAERRVRELGLTGYHRGLVESVSGHGDLEWVPSGTPCSSCRAASSDPENHLPPVHAGCACTLALA